MDISNEICACPTHPSTWWLSDSFSVCLIKHTNHVQGSWMDISNEICPCPTYPSTWPDFFIASIRVYLLRHVLTLYFILFYFSARDRGREYTTHHPATRPLGLGWRQIGNPNHSHSHTLIQNALFPFLRYGWNIFYTAFNWLNPKLHSHFGDKVKKQIL